MRREAQGKVVEELASTTTASRPFASLHRPFVGQSKRCTFIIASRQARFNPLGAAIVWQKAV